MEDSENKAKKTARPLPNPEEWRWCRDIRCQREIRELRKKQPDKDESILMRENPTLCAIFYQSYCSKHGGGRGGAYKRIIENYVRKNRKPPQQWANLREANLFGANLQKVDFYFTDLSKANLEEANLKSGTLRDAKLDEAILADTNLREVNLVGATFYGSFMRRVILDGAQSLIWNRVKRVGEEKNKWWNWARVTYMILKNYFHQQGRYEDESKAYFREKLISKKERLWLWTRGKGSAKDQSEKRKFWLRLKFFFRWLGLWFTWWFAGFGERWWLTALWALVVIVGFGFLYLIGESQGWLQFHFATEISHWFGYFYLSVVTFATLGFGDISPLNLGAQICAVIEVILGYVFLGTLVTFIAHKLRR
jgi:hypothetical protein